MSLRSRLLNAMAQSLHELAHANGIAVVVINQVTTKFSDNGTHIIPALGKINFFIFFSDCKITTITTQIFPTGESWGHVSTVRISLRNDISAFTGSSVRIATLEKSPSLPPGTAKYQVLQILKINFIFHNFKPHRLQVMESEMLKNLLK